MPSVCQCLPDQVALASAPRAPASVAAAGHAGRSAPSAREASLVRERPADRLLRRTGRGPLVHGDRTMGQVGPADGPRPARRPRRHGVQRPRRAERGDRAPRPERGLPGRARRPARHRSSRGRHPRGGRQERPGLAHRNRPGRAPAGRDDRRRTDGHPVAGAGQDQRDHLFRRPAGAVRPGRSHSDRRRAAHPARPRPVPGGGEAGALPAGGQSQPARAVAAVEGTAMEACHRPALRPRDGARPQGDEGGPGP